MKYVLRRLSDGKYEPKLDKWVDHIKDAYQWNELEWAQAQAEDLSRIESTDVTIVEIDENELPVSTKVVDTRIPYTVKLIVVEYNRKQLGDIFLAISSEIDWDYVTEQGYNVDYASITADVTISTSNAKEFADKLSASIIIANKEACKVSVIFTPLNGTVCFKYDGST